MGQAFELFLIAILINSEHTLTECDRTTARAVEGRQNLTKDTQEDQVRAGQVQSLAPPHEAAETARVTFIYKTGVSVG